jgi:hypothetical protein
MATLRSLTINALRFVGFWPIFDGLAAMANDIMSWLKLQGWQELTQRQASG